MIANPPKTCPHPYLDTPVVEAVEVSQALDEIPIFLPPRCQVKVDAQQKQCPQVVTHPGKEQFMDAGGQVAVSEAFGADLGWVQELQCVGNIAELMVSELAS